MSIRGFVCAAALAVALFGGASASAESVSFTTGFDFDPGAGVDNTADLNGGVFTLLGTTQSGQIAPASDVVFGTISYTGKATVSGSDSVDFAFSVAQSFPLPGGSGVSVGNEFSIHVNKSGSLAEIIVDGGTVTIGNVTYSLQDQSFAFRGNGTADILGTISVSVDDSIVSAPVPAAVWGGVALLGMLGGGKLYARRRDAADAAMSE